MGFRFLIGVLRFDSMGFGLLGSLAFPSAGLSEPGDRIREPVSDLHLTPVLCRAATHLGFFPVPEGHC